MTQRPTHATVPADIDTALLTDLTPGKKYRLEDWCDRNGSFSIIDDGGTRLGCASARKSGFLRGRDWLLTTEPPPEDQSATIARLERRVAVLREALGKAMNRSDEPAVVKVCADALYEDSYLADTEEQK